MPRKVIDLSRVSTKLRQTPPLDLHHTRVDCKRETRYDIFEFGAMYWQRQCEKASKRRIELMVKEFESEIEGI